MTSFCQENLTRILFILDASNSMNAAWGEQTRIEAAKELLAQSVDSLKGSANLEIALRVYGHQSPITPTFQDCNDTKLEVPFGQDNFDKIKSYIKTIKAKGTTPIARSLEASAEDFPDYNARNIIILITDGLEACDNDPCVIAKKLHDKKIGITPFVIGLGLDLSYLEQFKCIGSYSEAESKTAFKNALKNVVSKALVNTTAQINLNDITRKPSETDVTMFLYKAGTTDLKYTYIHTLNRFNNPDTLFIDPNIKYDLLVNTTPKVELKDINIKKNTHNTIFVDAPQGFIKTNLINGNKPHEIETRITLENDHKTINVQDINTVDKYIVGNYIAEVLTLPRSYHKVKVTQSGTYNIDIEAPGLFTYKCSNLTVGQIFVLQDNGVWDWVCNLNQQTTNGQWYLQPGQYRVVYRQKNIKSTVYTYTQNFRIFSNKTTSLNL
ncbi:MAG: vWA domain-containing protein [Crocinitomicaceae bacterium]